MRTNHILFQIMLLFGVYFIDVHSINCFKCTSFNGNNPSCEDPFNNTFSANLLNSPCWAGRKNRQGVFPATACIKMSGRFDDTGELLFVRDCALDSGSLTVDTELVRMSHCGGFFFDGKYARGCVQSCHEDACNQANKRIVGRFQLVSYLIFVFISPSFHQAI